MEEKKLTDEEIDVGLIERSVEREKYLTVWLYKDSSWKSYGMSKILDLIHRLQGEIERLTEEKNDWEKSCRLWSGANKSNHLKFSRTLEKLCEERNKNDELQKQVDELKQDRNWYKEHYELSNHNFEVVSDRLEQVVKDTAKEILQYLGRLLNEESQRYLCERYGVEVE